MSRYCYDREKTMTEVNALLESLAEIKQAKQKQFEPTPAPVKARSQQRSVTSSSSRAVSDKPRGSQKFTPDELVFMIGGGLLIGAIGWFLWGTAAALSVFGWVAAIASIVSGVGTVLGNQGIKTVAGIILLIIYIIFRGVGLIILWIEFLGWLTGLILGGAVSVIAQSSGAESMTVPKPFRLLVVLTIVILIGMGYAMTTSSSRQVAETIAPGTTGTPLETVEVVITDQQITMSNPALKTSFAMKVENKSSKTCELEFDLVSDGGYRVTYDQSPEVEKGETKTINFNFSNGGIFQLNCEPDSFNPNYLDLQGPRFTIRDK
ncbi:MAG: hypothetical protein ACK4QL_08505 [Pseudanabaenaceae cyanobacterium]